MMIRKSGIAPVLLSIVVLFTGLLTGLSVTAAEHGMSAAAKGKALAFSKKKGNCLACHAMANGVSPGNIGPPLIAMQQRYKSKADVRAQIWDSTASNPDSPMPPFGRHKILSDKDIDLITEFVWTL